MTTAATAAGSVSEERREDVAAQAAPALGFPYVEADRVAAAEAMIRAIDARLAARAEREKHLHLPARIVGESTGDHVRRGGPEWVDMPDEPPLGEEGGTAWTPDNLWLREEAEEPITL